MPHQEDKWENHFQKLRDEIENGESVIKVLDTTDNVEKEITAKDVKLFEGPKKKALYIVGCGIAGSGMAQIHTALEKDFELIPYDPKISELQEPVLSKFKIEPVPDIFNKSFYDRPLLSYEDHIVTKPDGSQHYLSGRAVRRKMQRELKKKKR
jgi:hypothetical protein